MGCMGTSNEIVSTEDFDKAESTEGLAIEQDSDNKEVISAESRFKWILQKPPYDDSFIMMGKPIEQPLTVSGSGVHTVDIEVKHP